MSEENQSTGAARLRVYASGGCGINIASHLANDPANGEVGFAEIDVVYIDTSRSDLPKDAKETQVFMLPGGVDGSGGERKFNAQAILKHAKEILQKHKPAYLNVVISSAAGGSGSVLAPVLASELLADDQLTVAITVGETSNGQRVKNTLDTLTSYEGIASMLEKSVVLAYFENNDKIKRTDNDDMVLGLIHVLALIFSRQNHGLDTRDLYNFLNFNKVTSYGPHLAGLEVVRGNAGAEHAEGTISVASAIMDKDDHAIDFAPPLSYQGIIPESLRAKNKGEVQPIHLMTKAYPFNDIATRLKGILASMDREAKARTQSSELAGVTPKAGGFLSL